MQSQDYQYTARQEGSELWEVAFVGARTRRAKGLTLHDAIQGAGSIFQATEAAQC